MSDTLDSTSLTSLASIKSKTSRDGVDLRSKNFSAQATSRAGFDGLLKTFLGKDKAGGTRSAGLAGQLNKNAASSRKSAASGSRMDAGQKKALRRSLDKTVPADDAAAVDAAASEDVRAAAEEAARLIWNLLYPGQDFAGGDPVSGGEGSVRQLAGFFNAWGMADGPGALAGMGAAGLDLESLQQAIETANASAEMNAAAVLSALDELLDGMPREALRNALAETARDLGMPLDGDLFNRIAAELDADIVSVDVGIDLLSTLGGRTGASLTAESAGSPLSASDILSLFKEFIEGQGPIIDAASGSGEETLRSFAAWLQETGKSGNNNELLGDTNKLADALLRAAGVAKPRGDAVAATGDSAFSQSKNDLETLLQTLDVRTSASESRENAAGMTATVAAGQASGPSAAATQPSQSAPAMNGMLDQINNIERLAEAMRMANKGPIKNLTMQLSPPELGKVMLRVEARDGVVSAILRVEKPEAAAQLANNLSQLRENLKAQGIELGELDIQQRGQNEALGDFSGQRRGRDAAGDYDEARGSGRSRGGAGDEAEEAAIASAGPPLNDDGTLNLFA